MFFCTFYENVCFLRKCTFFLPKSVSSADVLQPFFSSQLRKWKATSQNPWTKPKTKNIGFHQKITEDRGQRCETRTCQIHVITKFLSLSQDYFSLRGHADKPLSWKPADKVGQRRTKSDKCFFLKKHVCKSKLVLKIYRFNHAIAQHHGANFVKTCFSFKFCVFFH